MLKKFKTLYIKNKWLIDLLIQILPIFITLINMS